MVQDVSTDAAPPGAAHGVLTATVPGVPPYKLSPNARGVSGWTRSRLVKDLRADLAWWLRAVWGPEPPALGEGPLAISFVIAWPPGRKRLDDDNAWACLKAYRDQVAASLGLASDARMTTTSVTQQRAEPGDRAGWVRITVKEAT
jgi:hypothetical protein